MFKFYKTQEIPEFFYSLDSEVGTYLSQPTAKATNDDYLDFSATLIDNGDDKVCLEGNHSLIITLQ